MKLLILLLTLFTTDSLLQVYDHEITISDTYLAQRQHTIDSLAQLPPTSSRQLELAELYTPYQSDSATACLYRVMTTSPEHECEARIRLLQLFSSIGMFVEGFDLAGVPMDIPDTLRVTYFDALQRLYSWGANNCKAASQRASYAAIGQQYLDSLYDEASRLQPGPNQWYILSQYYRNAGNYKEALALTDSILLHIVLTSHDYAKYAHQRYSILRDMNLSEEALQWLIRSAITDVRCAVTDNGSSWVLANLLYQQGDMERANRYMEYSLNNVSFYNAPIRSIQINRLAHVITQAYQVEQQRLSRSLRNALLAAGIGLLLLIALCYYSLRQYRILQRLSRKQKHMNRQLESLSGKQQQYIGHFLAVYSQYIRRLSKMARRAGERDTDIFLSQEMQKFYNTFDETFLTLYPNFVNEFNALLNEDAQVTPAASGRLTTELRIYACVCLGIENVSEIAELLCYSPSTIYNYRVRIKNAARGDRDHFDERVRKLAHQPHLNK